MSTEQYSGKERRMQTLQMINELLKGRQQVWSSYCAVAGLESFPRDKPVEAMLDEFCQLLVDYISLGHFGIYQRITDGTERRRKIIQAAEDVYPRIAETTDTVIEFNDKYEKWSGDEMLAGLNDDLSRLGEVLAARIEFEDKLIEAIVA
jgi:regulator of sigma D